MKKSKGITLIALIITIIILLILAGITIGTLGGENGLFARAKQAREETLKETATEQINLKITNIQIASWAEKQEMPTLQELADGFCKDEEMQYVELATQKTGSFLLPQIDAKSAESIFVKLKAYPYEFEINNKLQLASIDNVKIETEVADNSEELSNMQKTIEELQKQVDELKTKNDNLQQQITDNKTELTNKQTELTNNQTQMGSRLDSVEGQIDEMITDLGVSTRTTLFNGTAGTLGQSYTISDISSYKYIIVYSDVLSDGIRVNRTSRIINVQDIVYNNSTSYVANSHYCINEQANNNNYFSMGFWFKNSTTLYIGDMLMERYSSPRIYKIEGLK